MQYCGAKETLSWLVAFCASERKGHKCLYNKTICLCMNRKIILLEIADFQLDCEIQNIVRLTAESTSLCAALFATSVGNKLTYSDTHRNNTM